MANKTKSKSDSVSKSKHPCGCYKSGEKKSHSYCLTCGTCSEYPSSVHDVENPCVGCIARFVRSEFGYVNYDPEDVIELFAKGEYEGVCDYFDVASGDYMGITGLAKLLWEKRDPKSWENSWRSKT